MEEKGGLLREERAVLSEMEGIHTSIGMTQKMFYRMKQASHQRPTLSIPLMSCTIRSRVQRDGWTKFPEFE